MRNPVLVPVTREVCDIDAFYNDDLDPETITEKVYEVSNGDDVYEFVSYVDARNALISITAAKAAGVDVWPCGWMVEDRSIPEPDSYSDLLRPCGAPAMAHADGNGFGCAAGHSHRSNVEWYEADEVAALTKTGHRIAPNAALMDGTPLN